MKEKTIILFECQEQKLWNKGMKGGGVVKKRIIF